MKGRAAKSEYERTKDVGVGSQRTKREEQNTWAAGIDLWTDRSATLEIRKVSRGQLQKEEKSACSPREPGPIPFKEKDVLGETEASSG